MGMRAVRFGVSTIVLSTILWAAPNSVRGEGTVEPDSDSTAPRFVVVYVEVANPREVAFLEPWIDVWAYHPRKGIVDAAVDAKGVQALRDFGFRFEIDHERTATYHQEPKYLEGQTAGIPGYPCYRTVEETLATGASLEASYPDLAEWIDIGDSWEKVTPGGLGGYDLMVLRLTNETNGIPAADKPDLWVMGSTHAREFVTAETVTRFAEHLLAEYGLNPDVTWVLDHHEVHLLLITNPDGRKHAESLMLWRKNTNEDYCGVTSANRGADLNRNFDFEWAQHNPYFDPCEARFVGASAASEPETQAVQDYVASNFPDWRDDDLVSPAPDHSTGIFIDVHSYSRLVLTAFGWQHPPSPNDGQILRLARKFSFFTDYYAQLGSVSIISGATKDWAYGRLGIPAFTFELGTEFFQSCSSFESAIYPDNLEALLYASRAVRAPYTESSGPEVLSPVALPSSPAQGETVTVGAVMDDTRFGPGESSPPVSVEAITAAEFYIDVPPWQSGATPIPMTAVDGAFDASVETVTGIFPTAGLADGRHTIYIRGQDGAGYWGTVRAVFVWMLDPGTAAHIAGMLTDSQTGLPLEGTVTAGPFSTASGPATGSYDLLLPPGTYDVNANAPGHYGEMAAGVGAVQGNTTIRDFELDPFAQSLFDDVESGDIGWSGDAPWAIVTNQSHSPVSSWHESPGGDSPDGANLVLEAPPLDLRSMTGVKMSFWHRYAIESGFDHGLVEWSTDGGVTWTEAASYTGIRSSWTQAQIPLPEFDGAPDARIRFRYTSDSNTSYDGWYIDDISVEGALFYDGFESGDTSVWAVTNP